MSFATRGSRRSSFSRTEAICSAGNKPLFLRSVRKGSATSGVSIGDPKREIGWVLETTASLIREKKQNKDWTDGSVQQRNSTLPAADISIPIQSARNVRRLKKGRVEKGNRPL